jgi:hypothetical protein
MIKKITIGILGILILSSCKKDYECECTTIKTTTTSNGSSISTTSSQTYSDKYIRLKKAEDVCSKRSNSTNDNGVATITSCELI